MTQAELVNKISAMLVDGEIDGDGEPYEQSIDDAFETLSGLIRQARQITASPKSFTVIGYHEETGETIMSKRKTNTTQWRSWPSSDKDLRKSRLLARSLAGIASRPRLTAGNLAYACDLVAEGEQA